MATPMMRQYRQLKEKYADSFLFFRLGDFYEMFFEDAVEASRLLNLTLTKRHNAPMCGVPHHAVDSYVGKLTKLGKKVAICDQLSDPSLPGIVERDVIRVVTPGTTFDERILDGKANNFLVGVIFDNEKIGLSVCDLTTGLFQIESLDNLDRLKQEIFRLQPAECIIDAGEKSLPKFLRQFEKLPVFPHQFWEEPKAFLAKHFGVKDLRGFGIEQYGEAVSAAALILSYLKETQKSDLSHLLPPQIIARNSEMIMDETAIRNLEIISSMREGKREGSLISVLDMTKTSMGGRMLRAWLLHPLCNKEAIEARLDAVSEMLKKDAPLLEGRGNTVASPRLGLTEDFLVKLPEILGSVLDMERLLGKISIGTGNGRDILGVAISLKSLEPMKKLLGGAKSALLKNLFKKASGLQVLEQLRENILNSIVENPPLSVKDGGFIRDGVNAELDELRKICSEGKGFIQKLQEDEIKKTGINSLKVKYNQVFGYYIEITKANLHLAPLHYTRKQTLVNAERFITPELKEYEEKVLGAEAKMKDLEYKIFMNIRESVKGRTREIQEAAGIFGTADVLLSLAAAAMQNRYSRPHITAPGSPLTIINGRHPVVEHLADGQFVPNDTEMGAQGAPADSTSDEARESAGGSRETASVLLITGPNMGGKSTYLRQTAITVLMAHMGSFVPADEAEIPLIDRIFTRVGASDNLVRGQSTFMVEMQEAAQILHYATKNSLIILDEIGRGTSTYDGVSLAWAILEHIHDNIGAKTLFATHYHELISVADRLPHAANYSVSVKEEKGGIVFLYRVKKGAVDRSYGIEVARLAGLPQEVIAKAKSILNDLEEGILDRAISARAKTEHASKDQLTFFDSPRPHRVIEELKGINVEQMTPMEALKKLDELKNISTE